MDEEIGKLTKNVTLETAKIELSGKAEGSIRQETSDAGIFQNFISHTCHHLYFNSLVTKQNEILARGKDK